MTTDQIAYMANVEQAQHNRNTEAEQMRSNLASEENTRNYNREYIRTNKANEKIKRQSNKEQKRSNKAKEQLTLFDITTKANTAENQRLSNERIAQLNAEVSKYTTEINAAARKYAADASAQAAKYAADVQAAIAAGKNASAEQIAEADRLSREIENSKDRMQKAVLAGDENKIAQEANAIKRLQADIDQAYKNGQLKKWQHDIIKGYLDSGTNAAGQILKSLPGLTKLLAFLGG